MIHDLRKDRYDLPTKEGDVLIYIVDRNYEKGYRNEIGVLIDCGDRIVVHSMEHGIIVGEIIAWSYIEKL